MGTSGLDRYDLELRHLRYFLVLSEELHFGRAAERLNIVQPALTAQIKALENILGVELVIRSKRPIELSEAGQQFARQCQSAIAEVGNAVNTAVGFAKGATGTLRLGFGAHAAMAGLVSRAIRSFISQWPSIKLTLKEMPTRQVSQALLRNEIDIGYAAAVGPDIPGTYSKMAGRWPWLLAVASSHRLAGVSSANISAISGENLAIYAEADGRSDIVGVLTTIEGLDPQDVYKTSHITSLMSYVSSGLGVAFVPASTKSLSFSDVAYLTVIDPIPEMEMRILWRQSDTGAPVANFLSCI
jgi:DNA-binding transcriptional LysR family regulator